MSVDVGWLLAAFILWTAAVAWRWQQPFLTWLASAVVAVVFMLVLLVQPRPVNLDVLDVQHSLPNSGEITAFRMDSDTLFLRLGREEPLSVSLPLPEYEELALILVAAQQATFNEHGNGFRLLMRPMELLNSDGRGLLKVEVDLLPSKE